MEYTDSFTCTENANCTIIGKNLDNGEGGNWNASCSKGQLNHLPEFPWACCSRAIVDKRCEAVVKIQNFLTANNL